MSNLPWFRRTSKNGYYPKIKSTTPCKHCRELGFIDEKLFAIIDDTAKFEDAADKLIDALMTPPTTDGDTAEV